MTKMIVRRDGSVRYVYTEEVDQRALAEALGGALRIERASHVEPNADGTWSAAMVGGPVLGPFALRSEALAAEIVYLDRHLRGELAA